MSETLFFPQLWTDLDENWQEDGFCYFFTIRARTPRSLCDSTIKALVLYISCLPVTSFKKPTDIKIGTSLTYSELVKIFLKVILNWSPISEAGANDKKLS